MLSGAVRIALRRSGLSVESKYPWLYPGSDGCHGGKSFLGWNLAVAGMLRLRRNGALRCSFFALHDIRKH